MGPYRGASPFYLRRSLKGGTVYLRSELATRHGAGVAEETTSSAKAYAPYPKWQLGPPENWDGLPWV